MGCDGNCKCKKDSKASFGSINTAPHTTFSMGYVKHFIYTLTYDSTKEDNNLLVEFIDFPEHTMELDLGLYSSCKDLNTDISTNLNLILRNKWKNNEAIKMPTKCYELPISYSKLIGYARVDDDLLKEFGWIS